MATITIDRSHVSEESLTKIAQNTNITHLSFGSKARMFIDILRAKLTNQIDLFEKNVDAAFLRGASGLLLEYLGEVWGLPRPTAKKAAVSSEEKNFNFYTLETNFGTINNGQEMLVPTGTRIFNTIETDIKKVEYILIEDVILPPNETKVFFSAKSADSGNSANVGENTLNFHDFINYADVLNSTLFVTNSSSIAYGSDEMSDDNYRFLIQQQPLSSERANFTAISTALKQIPGISDFRRVLYRRGIGTADWIIKAVTPTVSDSLLALAQEAIDINKSDGLDHMAVAPTTIGVQLFFSLRYKKRLESKEKNRVKDSVRQNLTNYINNLEIGQKLVLDQLVNKILNTSEQIESVGEPNKKFSKIFIYKFSDITNSKLKKTLINDYTAEEHERVIIEPTVENPIAITDNN